MSTELLELELNTSSLPASSRHKILEMSKQLSEECTSILHMKNKTATVGKLVEESCPKEVLELWKIANSTKVRYSGVYLPLYGISYSYESIDAEPDMLLSDADALDIYHNYIEDEAKSAMSYIVLVFNYFSKHFEGITLKQFLYFLYINKYNFRLKVVGKQGSDLIVSENVCVASQYRTMSVDEYENYIEFKEVGVHAAIKTVKSTGKFNISLQEQLTFDIDKLYEIKGTYKPMLGYKFEELMHERAKACEPLIKEPDSLFAFSLGMCNCIEDAMLRLLKGILDTLTLDNYVDKMNEALVTLSYMQCRLQRLEYSLPTLDNIPQVYIKYDADKPVDNYIPVVMHIQRNSSLDGLVETLALYVAVEMLGTGRTESSSWTYAFVLDAIEHYYEFLKAHLKDNEEFLKYVRGESCDTSNIEMSIGKMKKRAEELKEAWEYTGSYL